MTRTVKFCVRIHQGGMEYQSLRRIAIEADRLGYHSISLYDLMNVPTLECWTTLSTLASETERIRLVPLVLANLYRHPAVLAKMAATLDVISGGRLVLGIGAGGGETDHLASGIPYPSPRVRVQMLEEAVQVVKLLWSGTLVNHEGAHYTLHEALCDPAPLQKPHPPILIGGRGERFLMRTVAAFADINNMGFNMSIEEHARRREVLAEHCKSVGRDISEIETSQNANVFIGENRLEVERLLSSHEGASPYAIAGDPDECFARIQRYVDSGITYFFLIFPEPIDFEQLRLFAAEVMPRFAS